MRKILTVLTALLLLILTACGWKGEGHIERHTFDEAYYYFTYVCAGYNQQGVCTVQVPITNYQPESYGLDIRDNGGKIHNVTVNKDYWDSAKDGSYFTNKEQD